MTRLLEAHAGRLARRRVAPLPSRPTSALARADAYDATADTGETLHVQSVNTRTRALQYTFVDSQCLQVALKAPSLSP